ncbi:pentatricopeptide repeat-containing protein At2g22410, mitochondrial-like [Solanum pennellii]|uniref:Pentatricopeptide repeat-containing protein At2g22410, mitochondrial-like n=1 Tax=Solanum pennellii TaxID=28526 RepID=A0ABM1GXW5_SOLPN|nr:pentatricopeptide repeat-containing protein At2g22410, mitochondrial-like [Solanum pennellii]
MKLSRPFSSTSFPLQKAAPYLNSSNSIASAKELHAHLIRTQKYSDPFAISHVIRLYSLFPTSLHKALVAFNQTERPTLPIWNYMLRGLSKSDRPIEALHMYVRMRQQGFPGNNLTFIFIFKACLQLSDIVLGQAVHVNVLKLGYQSYLYVCNALIYTYGSCGDLVGAGKVFDRMSERDLVSWNSLICGYSQCYKYHEVLGLFASMQAENVKADAVTLVKVVLACSYLGDFDTADFVAKYIRDSCVRIDVYLGNTLIDMYGRRGLVILAEEVFTKMKEKNVVSWNAMIIGYAKAGDLTSARKLFDKMPNRDVISWTSMITGYCQANRFSDAIALFQEMMAIKVKPDEVTVASVLSACARLGTFDVGKAVHDYVRQHDIKMDIYVGNALVDMYCKCGSVNTALEVFLSMSKKDTVSWTSMISGLAVNGFHDNAIHLFSQMLGEGCKPTHGTFVGVLLACAHAGLVDKGLEYFESMEKRHGLVPEMKHYGCVVDLLCRSGNLNRAFEFINLMPMVADVVLWRMLLSACKLHGNVVLAEIAANKLLQLDPDTGGNYVLSSSTYATAERWDDAMKIRRLMDEGAVQRPLGWSSIEVDASSIQ